MRKDYRRDLEKAARQMILVHRVDTLSRLIVRTIMRNVRVKHAGIFLFNKSTGDYIVKVSKGKSGIKIPEGFTKVRADNPLISYFTDPSLRGKLKQDFLLYSRVQYDLTAPRLKKDATLRTYLNDLKDEMALYQARVLVPGFYRENLIGILFLGEKLDKTSFKPEELGFLSVLASDVVMAIQNAWLFEGLNDQLGINKKLFLSTVTALATAIEAKDKYTIGHTERVVKYSVLIARHLKTAHVPSAKDFEENLRIAALLHDIGKIGIPEKLLNKKTQLTEKERAFISRHPLLGVEILRPISEFSDVILGVKYHHERHDGKGYPFRLAGDQIPVVASIIAVADAFDAMTSDRPYRAALPVESAIREIRRCRGTQFNPDVVDAFIRAVGKNGELTDMSRADSPKLIDIESPPLRPVMPLPSTAVLAE